MSSPEDRPLAVRVEGLVKAYGAARAVDGLSLAVRRGECLGLLGPNGAGKTTTIRILSTLAAPTSGRVEVLGLDPGRDAARLRARIGVVPQEIALYEGLTGAENLEFFGRLHGLSGARLAERVAAALGDAGLADRAGDRVAVYSGGMQRRLNLVAALLHEPDLVFLDEPTVGIDPQSRHHVFALVDRLRARGATIVYTTHLLGEVERLCDRIVILDHGRVIAEGTLDELRRRASGVSGRGARLDAGARVGEALGVLRAAGIEVRVEEDLPGLEDVFLTLTGRALRDEDGA
ncbi:MAG: ABC transporter ATP-binding protein [Planctomycetes bacterium]|nr:ABC transporter ATP-binding protein [Planctomycetota bacterium]